MNEFTIEMADYRDRGYVVRVAAPGHDLSLLSTIQRVDENGRAVFEWSPYDPDLFDVEGTVMTSREEYEQQIRTRAAMLVQQALAAVASAAAAPAVTEETIRLAD